MEGGISKMVYMTRLRGAELTLAERAVLTTLWTYTNADLTDAYPSRTRIAADCGISRDGARKALRGLEAKGYIIATSRGGWTEEGNRATHYTLTLPKRGATEKPPGGDTDGGGWATEKPLSDPLPDPSSDPSCTIDSGESTESSSTIDPDGSPLEIVAEDPAEDQTDHTAEISRADLADPISPAFHRSKDRKVLVEGVRIIAKNRANGETEKLEDNLDQLLLVLNTFFDRADESIWGADYGWEQIPSKCTSAYEAGKWLNTFLNSWQNDEGLLEWTPYNWEAAA